jgi:cytochrome c-type biogenesis protein CcmH/NrfF
VQTVFLWVTPASVLVFLLALLIKEVPLRGREPGAAGATEALESAGLVG